MKLSLKRARLLGGIVACCAVAAASATSVASASATTSAPKSVVLVNCGGTGQVKPREYILTCADDGDGLTRLHWVSWGSTAYGRGTEYIHVCYPSCAQSDKYVNYPVLVVLWRVKTQSGQQYFSRLTEIRTGSLVLPHAHNLPRTMTWKELAPHS
jgi:hypothetical protein